MASKENWVILYGNAKIEGGQITHLPQRISETSEPQPTGPDTKVYAPHTILRSNIDFEQGTVSWETQLTEPSGSCCMLIGIEGAPSQSGTSTADPNLAGSVEYSLAFGLNVMRAPYGLATLRNWTWEGAGGAGHGSELSVKSWIKVAARVQGSNIDMYVDDVRVLSTTKTTRRSQLSLYMQGHTPVKFRNLRADIERPICFVIMQFTDDFNTLFTDVIRPVCDAYGYRVIRGDDFQSSGQILDDITQTIRSAALVIADVTPNNANVFYELGYAHAIAKPTILLSDRTRERLPFDISGFRTLFYDNTIGGKGVVEQRLKQHLDALRIA